MSRGYNFSAGPAVLPEPVLLQAQQELLEWKGERASVMEVSHRGKAFVETAAEAERDLRELLSIPDNYRVLFLQGGATQQFALIPINFAAGGRADYLVTGAWGQKAVKEASPYAEVRAVFSGEAASFTDVPDVDADFSSDAAYLHYTPNETIHGVEFLHIPQAGDTPLVADMSSTLLSRPLDVSRFGMIYAGAQKNIGPSGLAVAIIRDDLIERCPGDIAKIFNYREIGAADSMLNTPPTFAWYLAGLVFKWIREQGGLAAMAERNRGKAERLYAAIDGSEGFYRNPVAPRARSWMNVPFTLRDPGLDASFLAESKAAGLLALKGHRAVGGMRASIYNAMAPEGVDALIGFMADFARRNG